MLSRILVLEEDASIGRFVGRALSSKGWDVDVQHDAAASAETILRSGYSLVLLSVPFHGVNAESLIRTVIAGNPDQKFIVASSAAGGDDSVDYLRAGATDYLSKPFSIDELLARVQARLRVSNIGNREFERHLRRRGVALDLCRRKANAGKGEVTLTEREFVLLAHLMTNDGAVLTREQLLSELWGVPANSRSNLVECYVARLRAKLGEDVIETVWKRGYSFVGLYVDAGVQAVR